MNSVENTNVCTQENAIDQERNHVETQTAQLSEDRIGSFLTSRCNHLERTLDDLYIRHENAIELEKSDEECFEESRTLSVCINNTTAQLEYIKQLIIARNN